MGTCGLNDVPWIRKENELTEKVIQGTFHPLPPLLQHMRIDHGRGNVIVTKKRLNGSDICATLQQVGRKRVTLMESSP